MSQGEVKSDEVNGMSYKVFISASSKDNDLAQDLVHRLEKAGVKVSWFKLRVSAGENAAIDVNRGLREADEVIVLLTDHSIHSPRVIFEMGAASGLHKRVTPIVVGVEAEELPPMVRQRQYVRYADLHDYIADLERRAKAPELQPA